jgi:hypothetical protein
LQVIFDVMPESIEYIRTGKLRSLVVFGTSPGRRGHVLPTAKGDIPVYNNVREGLDDGLAFNAGVVHPPPSGVRDGVAELIRVNPDLHRGP